MIGDHLDYYFTANITNDNGWADHNSSRMRQAFGKIRYTDADTTISVSMGGADNTLNGSQTIPRSFMDNFRQAYTFPDTNENQVGYLTINARALLHAERAVERQRVLPALSQQERELATSTTTSIRTATMPTNSRKPSTISR